MSATILKSGNIPAGMRSQRNIKQCFNLWFWQFLVYYSYVPDFPNFQVLFGTSCNLSLTSCIDTAHGCIQEFKADPSDMLDKK